MRKHHLFGLLFGAACLWLAFRGVDWEALAGAFRRAEYAWVPLFVAAHLGGVAIRAARWRLIMAPLGRAGWRSLLSALSMGLMFNLVLPARAGELVRTFALSRRERTAASSVLATVVLERLFDGLAIILFLGAVPLVMTLPPGREGVLTAVRTAGGVALAAYAVLMAVLVAVGRRPEVAGRLAARLGGVFHGGFGARLERLVVSFGRGLVMLGSPGHIAAVAAWSLTLWLVIGLANQAVLLSFGLRLGPAAAVFLMVVQTFGVMAPSPGYVGALQYAHVLGLSLFGVPKEVALSVGLLFHGLLYLTYVPPGLAFLAAEGLTPAEAARAAGEAGTG